MAHHEDRADPLVKAMRELRAKQELIERDLRFLQKKYPKSTPAIRKLQEELGQTTREISAKEQAIKSLGYR